MYHIYMSKLKALWVTPETEAHFDREKHKMIVETGKIKTTDDDLVNDLLKNRKRANT